MAESYGFFDKAANDDRQYTASVFTEYFNTFFTTGIANGLKVNPQSGMNLSLDTGYAIILGYFYKNDTPLTLTLDTADPNLPRIDRVVLKLDLIARSIHAILKKGMASSSPAAPGLQRDSTVYEISLSQINIPAATTSITTGMITDERYNPDVCGISSSVVHPMTVLSAGQPSGLIAGDIWVQYI